MSRAICIVFAVFLTCSACASTTAVKPVCLPLKSYDAATERQLAVEVAALPLGAALTMAMVDYGVMRAADRACMGD